MEDLCCPSCKEPVNENAIRCGSCGGPTKLGNEQAGKALGKIGAWGCLGCVGGPAILLIICIFVVKLGGMGISNSQPTYQEGYTQGRKDGIEVRRTSGFLKPEEVDSVVEGVVSKRREKVYSKGKYYGDGWVDGVKAGMKEIQEVP